MANQRMFIRCKSCGSLYPLARRFISPYAAYDNQPQTLDEWFEDHGQWGLKCGGEDMGMDAFEISYEIEPDYEGRAMKWPEYMK